MLIHHYDASTGQYLSSNLADEDPQCNGRWLVSSFATPNPLPERPPKTWPFWRNEAWVFLPDYRRCVLYRTDNGSSCEILEVDLTPEQCGLTEKPRPSPNHRWQEGEWVIDAETIKQQRKAAAMAEFEAKMAKARTANLGKADAITAGLLDEIGVALFKAWAAYQIALVSIVEAANFPENLSWPNEPDLQEIAKEIAAAR